MTDPLPIVDDRALRRSGSEKDLLQFVRDAAALGGWLCYHTHRSDRSEAGFPDVVAVHLSMPRLVFAELKSAKGELTDDQGVWLEALRQNAVPELSRPLGEPWPLPEVYLWRPSDADQILQVLLGHRIHRAAEPDAYDRDTTPGT